MILKEVFQTLGFPTEYYILYQSLFSHGTLRMSDLAKRTEIARTSCYEYLPKLIELGLVEEINEGKSKLYKAKSPQNLIKLLYKFKNRVDFAINNIEYDFADIIESYEKTQSIYAINYLFSFQEIKREFESIKTGSKVYILIDADYHFEGDFVELLAQYTQSLVFIKIGTNKKKINNTIKLVFDDKLVFVNCELGCGVVILEDYIVRLERDFLNMHEL